MKAVCHTCKEEVSGDDGVVHVSHTLVGECERRDRAAHAGGGSEVNLLAYFDENGRVVEAPWEVLCDKCRPADHDCYMCYWFEVGRIDNWAKLIDWTSHLMEKTWLVYTNWDKFIRSATQAGDGPGLSTVNGSTKRVDA